MRIIQKFSSVLLFLILIVTYSCEQEEPVIPLASGYDEAFRPQTHFSSKYNWINDPNGLVYFDGEYHLFFQHNPFGSTWGYMSWGHAVSEDLIHWEQLNVVMKPDALGDIFSGCVVIDTNNTAGFGENAMIAIYTSAGATQSQSIAFSTDRGRTFVKYRANPVLPNPGRPDFRDPNVLWYEPTQQWIMSLATGKTISFYASDNLKEWEKLSEFGSGLGAQGGVWECPDLFPMQYENETKWALLVSINPGAPNGGSGTQYFIGDFDGKVFTSDTAPYPLWLDQGKDNYAGITWKNVPESDGRILQIAWMNNWEYAGSIPTYSSGGNGSRSSMTLPREITMAKHNGYFYLKNTVVTEINNIANEWQIIADKAIDSAKDEQFSLALGDKQSYQLHLNTSLYTEQELEITLMNDAGEMCQIIIDRPNNRLYFNRDKSGLVSFSNTFTQQVVGNFLQLTDAFTLDIYVDQSSIEIIANDGELTLTNQVFPSKLYNTILFKLNTQTAQSFVKYRTLNSIWR